MTSGFIPADRQKRIERLLQERGVVKVTDLSVLLGVSEITIRRDLDVLERNGDLERTHGGAVYNRRLRIEPRYAQKDAIHREEKEAIGRTAAKLVEAGDTLLINSGSTTKQVIRNLKMSGARIITSNLGAVIEAQESEMQLILVGGLLRSQSNSLVGSLATLSLKQVYGSKAFIGVDGLSVKYGLTTPILEEAEIAREMIKRTPGPVVVVADHSKLSVVSNFMTAPIDQVDILVTDQGLSDELREELEKIGIKVIIADLNPQI